MSEQSANRERTSTEPRRRNFRQMGRAVLRSALRITLVLVLILVVAICAFAVWEAEHSRVQAAEASRYAATLRHELGKGPSEHIRFPTHGPFDERLGYTRIPYFTQRLQARGFEVAEQARHNDALLAHQDRGLFAPYAEKPRRA